MKTKTKKLPSTLESIAGINPNMDQNTPKKEKETPASNGITGVVGSQTNNKIIAFTNAILKIEEKDPEGFQTTLTNAIRSKKKS